MADAERVEQVAAALAEAVRKRDFVAIRDMYTPDARVWHNFNDRDKTVEQSFEFIARVRAGADAVFFDDVRRQATEHGYVEQRYTVMQMSDGRELRFPTLLVVTLDGDRISRVEEYLPAGCWDELGPMIAGAMPV